MIRVKDWFERKGRPVSEDRAASRLMPKQDSRMPHGGRTPSPITPAQEALLDVLDVEIPQWPTALGRVIDRNPSTVAGLLRALQQKGYAVRRDDGWRRVK